MNTMNKKLQQVTDKANRIVSDGDVIGQMGLYVSSDAWQTGQLDFQIRTAIPEKLSAKEAMHIGWALWKLGKCASEGENDKRHVIDECDDDFFM